MGGRGNVRVHNGTQPSVFLYSHWGGYELPEVVAQALDRGKSRWSDDQYLTRIIFNEMTKGSEMETTGYGISTYLGDGGNRIVDVDTATQIVTLTGYAVGESYTFAEFISAMLSDSEPVGGVAALSVGYEAKHRKEVN